MTKILKLFSLLFSLIASLIFAVGDIQDDSLNQYRLYVTKVDPEFGCFALSNGVVCNLIEKKWRFEKLPETGMEIHLMPRIRFSRSQEERINEGEFVAFYFQGGMKRLLRVWLPPESHHTSLTYVSTKLECTKAAGWWSAEVHENVIELSDGSQWITVERVPTLLSDGSKRTVKEDPTLSFNPGNSVILTRDIESNEWSIINVSEEFFLESNRGAFAIYRGIEVKPYLEATPETTKE